MLNRMEGTKGSPNQAPPAGQIGSAANICLGERRRWTDDNNHNDVRSARTHRRDECANVANRRRATRPVVITTGVGLANRKAALPPDLSN